jgi:hypothetical protein
MIRANKPSRVFQKRTIRPLYGWHSAVPYACFLDTVAVGTTVLYPGQVATKTTGEQMDFCRAAAVAGNNSDVPFGLFNNFINGDMDELSGGTEISVWVGGRDAVFEILGGPTATETPLDPSTVWTTLNTARGGAPIYSTTAGRLTAPASGGALPVAGAQFEVARLIEAVSNTKIVVQLSLSTRTLA